MATAISAEPLWDGKVYPYIAPKQLKIDARLKLHREAADKLDPITYEVLRYALWNLNVEHGNTIVKVSGSPIAATAMISIRRCSTRMGISYCSDLSCSTFRRRLARRSSGRWNIDPKIPGSTMEIFS